MDWSGLKLPKVPPLEPPPLSGDPLKANMSPAGRVAFVEELLNPTYVETCPHCGSEVVRRGEPLISREDAFKFLEFPDE